MTVSRRGAGTLSAVSGATNGGSRDELINVADALLEEVRTIREQWEELDQVLARLESGDAPADQSAPDVQARPGNEQEDPIRLMALEMMRGGHTRAETTAYLRETFGLDPDESMLDELFAEGGRA